MRSNYLRYVTAEFSDAAPRLFRRRFNYPAITRAWSANLLGQIDAADVPVSDVT